MQTPWNRIVQKKYACKCSPCFSGAATCTRHTATAVFRSRVSSQDRFTVLSSSFLTAATLIDSDIKGRKRKKLLGEIEDAKGELKALDASQNRRLATLSTEYHDIQELALSGQCTWGKVLEWAEKEKRVRHALGFKDWKGIPLSLLEGFSTHQLQNALHKNTNLRKLLAGADSRVDTPPKCTVRKQRKMQWSSEKLAYCLSREFYRREIFNRLKNVSGGTDEIKQLLSGNTVQADGMITKLRKLPPDSADNKQDLTFPASRYTLNYQLSEEKTARLNSSLDKVFKFCRRQQKDLKYLITNICHHLLTSNALPNVETYTLLAKNFDKLSEHGLVLFVLDAADECKIRLNEEAVTFSLDYYAKTGSVKRFQNLASRMHRFGNGPNPAQEGLSLAQIPGITFDKYRFRKSEIRPFPKPSKCDDFDASKNDGSALKDRDFETMFVRAARNGQGVYASLIKGTLKFADDKKAMSSYIDLIREGHEPTWKTLSAILRQCYSQQDWRSESRVLQKIHTIEGANLKTYRWLLLFYRKRQDGQIFRKSLAGGIRRGIISPAVQYFPEQIEAMKTDLLLDLAWEYDALLQRVKDEKTSSEPPERLARWLGVINDQMAETAFEFGLLTLSCGRSPTKGFFLYTRIMHHRANLLRWAARGKSRVSETSHNVLDISRRIPSALADAPSGTHEVLHKVAIPRFLLAHPSSKNHTSIRPRTKHGSLWYPLFRVLVNSFREMRWLLRKLAQELGDIELSIRHGPTVGHMLHAKMSHLQIGSLKSNEWTGGRPSRLVHNQVKKTRRKSKKERRRPKSLAYQKRPLDGESRRTEWERDGQLYSETGRKTRHFGKPLGRKVEVKDLHDKRRLTEWGRYEKLHSQTRWESSDSGKTLNKAYGVRRFSAGLEGTLPKAVPIENLLNT